MTIHYYFMVKNLKYFIFNEKFYFFLLSKPKRQLNYSFTNFKKKICITKSTGYLVSQELGHFKYIKRSKRFFTILLLILKTKYKKFIKNLFCLYIKNYSLLQYIWLKKFLKLVKPKIKYFLFSKSYIISLKNRKRIKRRVFRLLKIS